MNEKASPQHNQNHATQGHAKIVAGDRPGTVRAGPHAIRLSDCGPDFLYSSGADAVTKGLSQIACRIPGSIGPLVTRLGGDPSVRRPASPVGSEGEAQDTDPAPELRLPHGPGICNTVGDTGCA